MVERQDETEFESFFAATARPLVGQAFVLTGNLQEAQDIAQEALTQAWLHWDRLREYDDPKAWARRVAHNLAVSRWRRMRVRRRHEGPVALVAVAELEAEHLDLAAAVRQLPINQRRCLVLHDLVGLTIEEIAKELGVPAGSVRGWLPRARQAVANVLRDEGGSDG